MRASIGPMRAEMGSMKSATPNSLAKNEPESHEAACAAAAGDFGATTPRFERS